MSADSPAPVRRLLAVALLPLIALAALHVIAFASDPASRAGIDDFQVFYAGTRELLGGRTPYTTGFVSPPWFALLVAPLALLPYPTASTAWFLVNFGALAVAIWGSFRLLDWQPGLAPLLLTVLVAVLWPPAQLHLRLGQNSMLVFALLALGCVAYRAERRFLAGLLLAAAAVKPQLASLLIGGIVVAEWRRFRTAHVLLGLALGVGVGLALSAALAPAWIEDVLGLRPRSWNYWGSTISFVTLFAWLTDGQRLVAVALYLPVAAIGSVLALARWWRGAGDVPRNAALTLAATLLLTPYAYPHDYIVLALPLLLWARHALAQPPLALLLGPPLLLAVWLLPRPEDYTPLRFVALGAPLAVLLATTASLRPVAHAARRRQRV